MPRLGEILLATKALTSTELDSALENHVLHGVKLGTCLVEMGYVSDELLAKCLGYQTGHSYMNKDQLLAAGSQHLSVITPAAIKKQRLVPVGSSGSAMQVATDDDISDRKQAEVERFLGREVELVAVSGYAMDCFLEQLFGVPRPGRFLPRFALNVKKPSPSPPPSPPSVKPPAEPPKKSVIIDGIEWKSLGDVSVEELPIEEEHAWTCSDTGQYTADASNTPERLIKAKSRNDVAEIILELVNTTSDCAALFIIRDDTVRGWQAVANSKKVHGFDNFSAPLPMLPDMYQCVLRKSCLTGSGKHPETDKLLRLLNCKGDNGVYFPILIQQRVVAVLFCKATDRLDRTSITELCRKASYALEILILRSKILS